MLTRLLTHRSFGVLKVMLPACKLNLDKAARTTLKAEQACLMHKTIVIGQGGKVFSTPPPGATAPSGSDRLHYRDFTITLRHTTLGWAPLDEGSVPRRDLYLATHDTHKRHTYPCPRRDSNPQSQRATADPRLRSRGHWDQPAVKLVKNRIISLQFFLPMTRAPSWQR
jgi:hypothetical protein